MKNEEIELCAQYLEGIFKNFHMWRSMVEDDHTIETIKLRGIEFNLFDIMDHVRRLPVHQQIAIEYLRLGVEDRQLKRLNLGTPAEIANSRSVALKQLAVWCLQEEKDNTHEFL